MVVDDYFSRALCITADCIDFYSIKSIICKDSVNSILIESDQVLVPVKRPIMLAMGWGKSVHRDFGCA